MIEKDFVKKGVNRVRLEEFLDKQLGRANYSHIEMYKTPISTRIIIVSQKPGIVIGRGGEKINSIIELLKTGFGIDNPVVEAEEIPNVDLDAKIVAKNIASWLEKGGNPKRIANTYLNRVMNAGAVGVQIEIKGKLSGERKRALKLKSGYVKRCGGSADKYVDVAKAIAKTKPGTIGVRVRIMTELPEYYYKKKLEKIESEKEVKEEEEGKTGKEEDKEKVKEEKEREEAESKKEYKEEEEKIEERKEEKESETEVKEIESAKKGEDKHKEKKATKEGKKDETKIVRDGEERKNNKESKKNGNKVKTKKTSKEVEK